MLVKDRSKSLRIKKLEVFQRRLMQNHPKLLTIADELGGRLAGHHGEQSNDYFIKPFLSKGYTVLHDLRLAAHDSFFQIDTLLISTRYILILEVKYITGTLHFDHLNQVIRIRDDGSEEAFQNPIYQVKRQRSHLTDWLSRNRVPNLPIHSLVVMSNPRTIIKSLPSHKDVIQYITHSPYLKERIQVFDKMHSVEKLTKKEITKLSKLLVRQHTPDNPDLLKRYQIEEKDIIKGVYCTKCFYLPVVRKNNTWVCPKCSKKDRSLHLPSLEDYALLYGQALQIKNFVTFFKSLPGM